MKARRALAFAIVLTASSAAAAPNDATRRKEAQALFDAGVKQAQAGDAKTALASFREAYAKLPSVRVLYNIGQLCERTGDAACAVRAYEQYVREGEPPPKRREQVEASLRALAKSVGTIAVRSAATGADVTIDGEPAGTVPLERPYAVNPGPHDVSVAQGEKSADKTVAVGPGEATEVALDLEAAAPAPPPEPKADAPAPAAAPDTKPTRTEGGFPVVPWIVTGTLAAATVVTGLLTANAYSRYQDKRDSFPITRGELDDAQGSARTLFIVTGVLGAATVVSAGLATWFTVAPQKTGAARRGIDVAIGPASLGVTGVLP